jgi:hypothetical protein
MLMLLALPIGETYITDGFDEVLDAANEVLDATCCILNDIKC